MTKSLTSFSAIAVIMGALLHAGAAGATAAPAVRTWVSGVGSDANPCTRALPCATFQQAYMNTLAGGEIDVLDGGDFGPLNIGVAITIANDGTGTAAITTTGVTPNVATGAPAITAGGGGNAILIQAGPGDAVVLRGLNLNGATGGNYGIAFASGASLLVDHCIIQEFHANPGILFSPSTAASLVVTDTVLSSDGTSSNASVWIQPSNGATATAHFERVQILNAIGNGMRIDGTFGGGATDVELHDVTVDRAAGGSAIVALSPTSGGPTVKLLADNVTSSHNAGYGFRAVGGTASVSLRHSTIEDDGVGIGVSGGGQVFSYGDNSFANNVSGDGVTPTPIGLK